AAVTAASLVTTPDLADDLPAFSDKLVHAGMYAGLTLLFLHAYPGAGVLRIGLALSAYGGTLELVQALTPERSTSLADAIANCAGISIMLAVETLRARHRERAVPPRAAG
ncbi:MAG: VanZ family protein, partial [Gammaproteobacteria bacterium]